MRTHVVLPEDVVKSVDELVGPRKRSEFIAEAVSEKVRRLRLSQAAHKAAGALKDVDIPEWETSEKTIQWIRESRRADDQRLRPGTERSDA